MGWAKGQVEKTGFSVNNIENQAKHCENWSGFLNDLWFQVGWTFFKVRNLVSRSALSQSWLCPFKKSRLLTLSDSEQCEMQRKRRKGKLTSLHNRWCDYNSEPRWKLKPPNALGYLITANFRTLRVFTLQVLASSRLPQQILNFPSNLFTHFNEKAQEFTWIA